MGERLQSIDEAAFGGCTALNEVYCHAVDVPEANAYAFVNTRIGNATLYVPEASVSQYTSTAPWSGFGKIVALPDDVVEPAEQVVGDLDGDGAITVNDITLLINIYLGGEVSE